jgi:deazaflavin-dependent oxidoreductase (nitroreductase family)
MSFNSRVARAGAGLLRVRWFVRAPIWLFRARLGFLLGPRMLMLEHIGRKSGQRRFVVLEIIDHPSPDRYVVVSGFGDRAQWFRNVRANSRVRVFLGGRRPSPASAVVLSDPEAKRALDSYARRHPRSWATLRPVLESTLGTRIGDAETELPMVLLDLADGSSPI